MTLCDLEKAGTCCNAVKRLWHKVSDHFPLEKDWTTTGGRIHCGITIVHPVYKPLEVTVTVELIPTKISEKNRIFKGYPKHEYANQMFTIQHGGTLFQRIHTTRRYCPMI